jgi:hypothetical protein
VNSPIVWPESGEGAAPDPDNVRYVPTTWPGARLPHVWLADGSVLHDRLGSGYTLLRLGKTSADTHPLERAFEQMQAPLATLAIDDERVRELYEYDLLLVRPDLHVAWRGNKLPENPAALAALALAFGTR